MTDTPRTKSELLTIFADNQNHAITAQDMRDYVVSVKGDHIGVLQDSGGSLAISSGHIKIMRLA